MNFDSPLTLAELARKGWAVTLDVGIPESPETAWLQELGSLAVQSHRLQAEHEANQNAFTQLGRDYLRVRDMLQKSGYDLSFNLSEQTMLGITRAADEPQQAKAEYAGQTLS